MKKEPQKPDWKQSRCDFEIERSAKRMAMPLSEILPNSGRRIGYLEEPEKDLNAFLDFLQSEGIPMGSKNWALRAQLLFERQRRQNLLFHRALRDLEGGETVEIVIARLNLDLAHERKMYSKYQPSMPCHCDWCGWDGARYIGDGFVACFDCLPQVLEEPQK